jgi:hypothetical protein
MSRYQVIVGNIGTVYDGDNMIGANLHYGIYKGKSLSDDGRASGEDVTLMDNDEIKFEHLGHQDGESND